MARKWIAWVGGLGAYVATNFVRSTTTTTYKGTRIDVIFSFYKPAAFGNGSWIPRLVWTAQAWTADPPSTVVTPFTIGSYASAAQATQAAQQYIDGQGIAPETV
jgi:hypothetical protein